MQTLLSWVKIREIINGSRPGCLSHTEDNLIKDIKSYSRSSTKMVEFEVGDFSFFENQTYKKYC